MKSVSQQTRKTICSISLFVLTLTGVAQATSVIVPSDDEMVIGARAIVRGQVVSVGSRYDESRKSIFTYITLRVEEVLKGRIVSSEIILKEPGGVTRDQGSVIFGVPEFKAGENVLLFLDTWPDGSLRTYQWFLGKFVVATDRGTGRLMVSREIAGENVNITGRSTAGPITDRMDLASYTTMIRAKAASLINETANHEARYFSSVPLRMAPLETTPQSGQTPAPLFTFINGNNPPRWFEPDSNQSVVFKINPSGAPNSQIVDDMLAAMNAWSSVSGTAMRVTNGGTTNNCGLLVLDGENTISFNNCDNYSPFSPPVGSNCSGVLAAAGIIQYSLVQTKVVNGITFYRALEGNLSFNPYASCYFSNRCNVQEVATHELGHALGLGHSLDGTATMYAYAHFDGRCAGLRDDDMAGIRFIYPPTAAPPPPPPPPPTVGGLQFYPLPYPVRLLDTRAGAAACTTPGVPLTANSTLTQNARVTCNSAIIPSSAQAIVGNATAVNISSSSGYISFYPSGTARPNVSNLNYAGNQIIAAGLTVGLGGNGAFSIFAASQTHVIVDVTGYYAPPGSGGLYYHPLPNPLRLLDTRPGNPACDAPGVALPAGSPRSEQARVTCHGITIPANAQAIVGNGTVVNNGFSSGFITLYPNGVTRPNTSNLNYYGQQVLPNSFTAKLGGDGRFNIFAGSSTHFIVDVTGYYSADATDVNGTGLLFYPLSTPIRLLDTRPGEAACHLPAAPLAASQARAEFARVSCYGVSIPGNTQAINGNATVVNLFSSGGFVTLYPSGATRPLASNLNYLSNQIIPNSFTVRLGANGSFDIYPTSAIHFIVDLTGYFAP